MFLDGLTHGHDIKESTLPWAPSGAHYLAPGTVDSKVKHNSAKREATLQTVSHFITRSLLL